jgi:hypothetical protein
LSIPFFGSIEKHNNERKINIKLEFVYGFDKIFCYVIIIIINVMTKIVLIE